MSFPLKAILPQDCIIPSNPDISGIGVRVAIYLQNFLCFFPAIWAIWDGEVSDYELVSAETQTTTNLVLAFAILISCIVQALTLGLTSYHATIVLSLSWMNNTNAFVYFLLYVRLKSQGQDPLVPPQWSSWVDHIKSHLKALLRFSIAIPRDDLLWRTKDAERGARTEVQVINGGVKILFRRLSLFLGSLHLSVMAALGIWLWSAPRSFGESDASCAVDFVVLTIVGARVDFASSPLRIISLAIYGLFLLPGFNLLLPMATFLGFYCWHHAYRAKGLGGPRAETEAEDGPHTAPRGFRPDSIWSPVFPVYIGLLFLFAINVVFVTDIELTLRRNRGLQGSEQEEEQWGFGQILAMLLVFMPLRDLIEMTIRRTQELRTKLNDLLKQAIQKGDDQTILDLIAVGANPNTVADDGRTALEVMSLNKNWEGVHTLVSANANTEVAFRDGRTILEVAIRENNPGLVRALVEVCTNINTPFLADGRTPLEVATLQKSWKVVEVLIDENADVNAPFRDGRTVLEIVARDNNWDLVRALVKANADVNAPFQDGQTALGLATLDKNWQIIAVLMDPNADLNATIHDGLTALEIVACEGNWGLVRTLVNAGADVNILFKGEEFRAKNIKTVLHAVCHAKQNNLVELLLEKGANPNITSPFEIPLQDLYLDRPVEIFEYGTALHYACSIQGETALGLVKQLLEYGADPNLEGGGYCTPLQAVCLGASLEVATVLLDWGADPNVQGGRYGSALQGACAKRLFDIVHALLGRGANINAKGGEFGSALQAACNKNSLEIVKILLERGANPNVQAGERGTALQIAVDLAAVEMVHVLLDKGADPNLSSYNRFQGQTPMTALQTACTRGLVDIAGALLEKGANVNVEGVYGLSVYKLARIAHGENSAIVQLLRRYGAV